MRGRGLELKCDAAENPKYIVSNPRDNLNKNMWLSSGFQENKSKSLSYTNESTKGGP